MKTLTDTRIVLSEFASYNELRHVKQMLDEIEETTGVRMALVTDAEPAAEAEIVFGKTNRAGSAKVYESLPHGAYAIASEEDAIYVAYDNYLLAIDAMEKIAQLCKEAAPLPLHIVEIPDHGDFHMDKADDTQVRVMTTNIVAAGDLDSLVYLGEKYGVTYIDRVDIQSTMILDYLPDFIGLQEIQEGTVNDVEGYMHTELLKRIGHEYTEVNLDVFVPEKVEQWTPIAYRHTKWELLEYRAATNDEILNVMHRWQWGVYRNKENGQLFVHMNLHGPHGGNQEFRDFQPVFFSRANAQVKALLAKYPNVPIAVTGDYNQRYDMPSVREFQNGTTLDTAYLVAKDTTYPQHYGTIDHIMINTDVLDADVYRMIDNGLLYMSSDHRPCFVDLRVKK